MPTTWVGQPPSDASEEVPMVTQLEEAKEIQTVMKTSPFFQGAERYTNVPHQVVSEIKAKFLNKGLWTVVHLVVMITQGCQVFTIVTFPCRSNSQLISFVQCGVHIHNSLSYGDKGQVYLSKLRKRCGKKECFGKPKSIKPKVQKCEFVEFIKIINGSARHSTLHCLCEPFFIVFN